MPRTQNVPLLGARRRGPATAPAPPAPRPHPTGTAPAALVAVAFTLAQLFLVTPSMGLGWDETVYVGQVSGHAPAAFFSAPRARGVSVLVAPIAAWSSSTAVLRVYLAVLSGLALFVALRAWRGLFPARVLAVAGALFASLWVTLFYGPQAMPNYWVAVGALACAGCFLRAAADPADRRALWGLGLSAALMTLMRPTDAVWATLPLPVAAAAVPRLRRLRPVLVLAAGLLAGGAQWVVEAYTGYGGLGQRLADASRIQGGLGWNIAVLDQARSLGGRALCRPCAGDLPGPATTLWWFALPLAAALAVVLAVRARRPAATVLLVACAATAALPYLFMIGYAAPRFLLPAYALLAIPVADVVVRLATRPGGAVRPVAATLVALALAAHLAVQFAVLQDTVRRTTDAHRGWAATAAELHRLGVRPPCRLTGHQAIPVAFYARCAALASSGHNANTTAQGLARAARTLPFAVVTAPGKPPPSYARAWTPHRAGGLDVYVSPRTASRAP
ncbi:hypothetical protein ACGFS9_15165 [Streptomyces sp. NPDC048566]|uniref:hypothetical protein n=1 Tax=Streptomyces sp. NPDC048566 TaxID=3365569 RepID=UPI0037161AEF